MKNQEETQNFTYQRTVQSSTLQPFYHPPASYKPPYSTLNHLHSDNFPHDLLAIRPLFYPLQDLQLFPLMIKPSSHIITRQTV